jgi:L-asparaginase
MSSKAVLIIYTGGTIGMMEDPDTGSLIPFDFQHLAEQMPELRRFGAKLKGVTFPKPIDSSDINISDWKQIAQLIEKNYADFDGFVVLHGTDTMAYSASALSFMLEGLQKPVIFTGSQLPIGVLRTDGKENLITAIELAATSGQNRTAFTEVGVYFGSSLYRGNRTHKYSTENFNAINSPNFPALAEAGIHIVFRYDLFWPQAEESLHVRDQFNDRVSVLKLFPGMRPEMVQAITRNPELKGLILETFGSGNAPRSEWFLKEMKYLQDSGVVVINVSQCSTGFIDQGKYETSAAFDSLGIVAGSDLTFEAALVKLMWLLGQGIEVSEVRRKMGESIRGELTSYDELV